MVALKRCVPLLAAGLLALPVSALDFSGYVGVQQRAFYDTAQDARQGDSPTAFNVEPEWYLSWNNSRDAFTFSPYLRYDSDDNERSHVDIRELYWLHVADNWELGAGVSKVFWGVTESQHLVDIINQTDLVEAPDGEEKLGQPMVRWSTIRDWGALDLFLLPGFRERTFPGDKGRLRPAIEVDEDGAQYQSSAEKQHVDVAGRWLKTLGSWDVGVSLFRGTSREPEFRLVDGLDGDRLQPYYSQITQYGIDAQMIAGEWLWKFESIYRDGGDRDFSALTGGFEYTRYGVWGAIWDLGMIAEYSHDSRDESASSGLQNDVFVGARLALNDAPSSEVLLGISQDLDNSAARTGKVEASTRIGDATKVYFEVWYFDSDDPIDPVFQLRQDSFVELSVEYYF